MAAVYELINTVEERMGTCPISETDKYIRTRFSSINSLIFKLLNVGGGTYEDLSQVQKKKKHWC
jgi:hypothetical protein